MYDDASAEVMSRAMQAFDPPAAALRMFHTFAQAPRGRRFDDSMLMLGLTFYYRRLSGEDIGRSPYACNPDYRNVWAEGLANHAGRVIFSLL